MQPQIADLGFFIINGYGLMIGIAIPLCFWIVGREARRVGLDTLDENLIWMFFWIAGSAFLGGKLAWIIGYPDSFAQIKAQNGISGVLTEGFVFFGIVIVGIPVTLLALRFHRIPALKGLDVLILSVPLGHAFGRLGCFLAGCCYGARSDVRWAVRFPTEHTDIGGIPVHPVQLYEAGGSFVIFLVLWFVVRPRKLFDGQLTLTYLLMYAVLRLITEIFRGDGNPVYVGDDSRHAAGAAPGGLTQAQVISLVLLVVIGPWLWTRWRTAVRSEARN